MYVHTYIQAVCLVIDIRITVAITASITDRRLSGQRTAGIEMPLRVRRKSLLNTYESHREKHCIEFIKL